MPYLSIPALSAYGASLIAIITYIVQRKKYAHSIAHNLGLENFLTYVSRGFGYRLLLHLQPWAAARFSLRDFALNRLGSTSSVVHVPAPIPVNLPLDRMFVPLTAVSTNQDRISTAQIAQSDYKRVLLVGDPGSGKSTVVRKIYRDVCRTAVSSPAAGLLPVLIELKNLELFPRSFDSNDQQHYLLNIIRQDVESVRTYSSSDLFNSLAINGRLVVLLDGLDEVRTGDLDNVWRDILHLSDQLARKNPANKLIVTTRRQLYVNLPDYFLSAFDAHMTLESFTPDEMYQFLTKWPYINKPADQIARLFRNLAAQPNIQSMCATPLILAMYVALDQITGGEYLPETRPDFYKAVADELLVRRRGRQLGLTTGLNMLRRTRQQILGTIALEHMLDVTQSRNNLRWDAAVDVVQRLENISREDAEIRLRELSRDTGLFTEERREESIRFIHLTFCEFMAAQMIVNGAVDAWDQIVEWVVNGNGETASTRLLERFAEVIIFAVSLETNQNVRQQKIRWAAKSTSIEIALRTLLDSQAYDDPVAVGRLEEIAKKIAQTPSDRWDDEWLYSFRQVAITLRDRELVLHDVGSHIDAPLSSFFREAVGDSAESFQTLFLSYLRLDIAGAMEMARTMRPEIVDDLPRLVIRALDEPDVLTYVLSEFRRGGASVKDWAAVLALGALSHVSLPSRLSSEIIDENLKSTILSLHRRKVGWHQCWVMRDTLLGYIFEAGCSWPASSGVLSAMAQLPIRRRRVTELFFNVKVTMWATISILFATMVVSFLYAINSDSLTLITVSVVSFLVLLGIFAIVLYRLPSTVRNLPSNRILANEDNGFLPLLRLRGGRLEHPGTDYLMQPLTYMKDRRMTLTTVFNSEEAPGILRAMRFVAVPYLRYFPVFFFWSPNSKLDVFAKLAHTVAADESGVAVSPIRALRIGSRHTGSVH